MKHRRLGKTELIVSVVGVGTWQLGGEWGKTFEQAEVDRMFRRAEELGVNLVDTAECYGDHESERLVGSAIHDRREHWIVATKFGHRYVGFMQREEPRSAADVRKQLEDSLTALRTDYIDLYQYHSVRDSEAADEDVHEMLVEQKKAGKIRHIGNSIGSQNENLKQVEMSETVDVEVIQVLYNRLQRGPEARVLPECRRQDLGVLSRVPLASGFLSGKYKPGAKFKPGDTRAGYDQGRIDEWTREVERIRREEAPPDVDLAQWALAWCLRHPAVAAVIPGCKSVEQVEANARAVDLVDPGHPLDRATPMTE